MRNIKCLQKIRVEAFALSLCALGMVLIIAGLCSNRWRVDEVGTKQLDALWYFSESFDTKTYGVLTVKGSNSQSWNTLTRTTCEYMNAAAVGALATAFLQLVKTKANGATCTGGAESCLEGFSTHMTTRCEQYQKISTLNTALLAVTLVGILMGVAGIVLSCVGSRKKLGGIGFGLLIFPAVLLVILNISWLFVTDEAFTKLGTTAWYPYPSIGIGYYLHLEGSLLLLIASGVFGWLVLPEVNKYDSVQETLDKKRWQLNDLKLFGRRADNEAQYLVSAPQMPQSQFNGQMPAYMMQPQPLMMPYGDGVQAAPAFQGPALMIVEQTEMHTSMVAPTSGANVYGSPMGQGGGDFGLSAANPPSQFSGPALFPPGGGANPSFGGGAKPIFWRTGFAPTRRRDAADGRKGLSSTLCRPHFATTRRNEWNAEYDRFVVISRLWRHGGSNAERIAYSTFLRRFRAWH